MIKKGALKLYRGIAVDYNEYWNIIHQIKYQGIIGNEGKWNLSRRRLRDRLDIFYNKPNLSFKDTRSNKIDEIPVICACADLIGASFYALKHNRNKDRDEISLIIHFEANIDDIWIDGRDFLYNVFQISDINKKKIYGVQKEWLIQLFGKRIIKYFEKSGKSKDIKYKIAMCDLATEDETCIRAHAKNKILIKGRWNTYFCSSFMIKVPIFLNKIISVKEAEYMEFNPDIIFSDFLKGKVNIRS